MAANWRHGGFHVTPGMVSAVRYAGRGAARGGEVLQCCRDALGQLAGLDPDRPAEFLRGTRDIGNFLKPTGWRMLVETATLSVSGLSPERPSDEAGTTLAEPVAFDEEPRELVGQLINFRLGPAVALSGACSSCRLATPVVPSRSFNSGKSVSRTCGAGLDAIHAHTGPSRSSAARLARKPT